MIRRLVLLGVLVCVFVGVVGVGVGWGLPFAPAIDFAPVLSESDSPSGLDVTLNVPQNNDPNGLASAELQDTVVTLPAGMSLSPSAANGLEACTDAELSLDTADPPECPAASSLGSANIDTDLLPQPNGPGTPNLDGTIYLGSQASNDPTSGNMFRLFIVVNDPTTGILVKLEGSVIVDPSTGQITTEFLRTPQLPFTNFYLHFNSGPNAGLATPPACGSFTAQTVLTPWSAPYQPSVALSSPFVFDSGPGGSACASSMAAEAFTPGMVAGSASTQAGGTTSFAAEFSRSDGQQWFSSVGVTLPEGLLANISDVVQCSASDAAAGTCGPGSLIGTSTVASGPGPEPFVLSGQPVYFTGPYEGGPFGLEVVAHAAAGPFDLGRVIVRQAIFVNPVTAQVTVDSDPFPQLLAGVPLRIRSVEVNANRPDFTVNPTSCNPEAVNATVTSTDGVTVPESTRFQVANCSALGFAPKLSLSLTNATQTTDGHHPGVNAEVTEPGGAQTNIAGTTVTLPLSLALDPNNAQSLCTFAAGQADACPANSIVGQATAVSPLLNSPLSGPVYFVKNIRLNAQGQPIATLPTLLVDLNGELHLVLRATSSVSTAGNLVTTFSNIPDAPISSFNLTINGGQHGIIVVTGGQNICVGANVAQTTFNAQNGDVLNNNETMSTPCHGTQTAHIGKPSVRKHTVRIAITVPKTGFITATGNGLRTAKSNPLVLGRSIITLTPSKAGTNTLNRTGHLKTRITIHYTCQGLNQTFHTTTTIHR